MDLLPGHRQSFQLPGPWPACAAGLLRAGGAWLHSGDAGESLLAWPSQVLRSTWNGQSWSTFHDGMPLLGGPWESLEAALQGQGLPWLGAATFELACDEAGLTRQPLAPGQLGQHWMSVPEALYVKNGTAELWSWQDPPPDPAVWTARLTPPGDLAPASLTLAARWREDQHRAAVTQIVTHILAGDFYVANLCMPFEGRLQGDPLALAFPAFQRACPPFGALLDLDGTRLLSLSMERLLSRRGDRLWSQPIKGSTPLTGDATQDRAAGEALVTDPKERAEHTMILDLVRNDLGRVAQAGSVQVARSMALETFPTVQHLVSTIEAKARPGLGLAELLRAVLPGGSVTGAPKHAVCAHLARTEAGPRGFYCGAIGWISPGGDLDLALPIRTAQIHGDRLTYWAGGGITRRSDPAREWAELHLKTRAITG